MNLKNKIFILGLVLFVLISISFVSASDNVTDVISTDNADEISIDESEILTYSDNELVKENIGENNTVLEKYEESEDNDVLGNSDSDDVVLGQNLGNDNSVLGLDESNDLDISNAKLSVTPIKMSVKEVTTTQNKYFVLKVTVKDKYGHKVDEGTVKFTINGKTYKVKVKNGLASKKLKLSQAKTYKFKATFSADGYKSKSVSSKVIVKAKKYRYFKKGKYSFGVTKSQYKRIQYVKNHKYEYLTKYADFKVKTGKHYNGRQVYAIVTTWAGLRAGHYYNYPQVQFVVMYGKNTWEWDFLTAHYRL